MDSQLITPFNEYLLVITGSWEYRLSCINVVARHKECVGVTEVTPSRAALKDPILKNP